MALHMHKIMRKIETNKNAEKDFIADYNYVEPCDLTSEVRVIFFKHLLVALLNLNFF